MCVNKCGQDLLDKVEDVEAFKIVYDFQAFDGYGKKQLGEFKGTFMDAFKFINKNKGVYVY